MPVPLDEFPIHQVALSLEYVGSTDRNFYDRSYFNAHDRTGDLFLVTGYGVYPNLGVKDAYATLRRGDTQYAVRFSDALDDDRMTQAVGGYRVEVVEPLQRIRLVCEADDPGPSLDITWEGSFPAVQEQPHVMRAGARAILDASRFAQLGTWEGVIRLGGEDLAVTPTGGWARGTARGASGPSGEGEPAGRNADEPLDGFWWLYVPMRFDEFAIVLIVQERRRRLTARSTTPPASGPTGGSSSSAGPGSTSATGAAPATPSTPRSTAPRPPASRWCWRSTRSGSWASTWVRATAATPTGATASGRAAAGRRARPTT